MHRGWLPNEHPRAINGLAPGRASNRPRWVKGLDGSCQTDGGLLMTSIKAKIATTYIAVTFFNFLGVMLFAFIDLTINMPIGIMPYWLRAWALGCVAALAMILTGILIHILREVWS